MVDETVVEEQVSKLPTGKVHISLYLRAPNWITKRDTSAKKIKDLNNRITEVRFPRQKSAHFCYIDFGSAEDRDKALKELQSLPEEQKIFVSKVTKDKPKQLEKHIGRVQQKREAKKEVIALLKGVAQKEQNAKSKRNSELSSKVSVIKVPRDTTINDIKKEFPNAINISLDYPEQKNSLGKALLTYATPGDALTESKRSVTLNGSELKLRVALNREGKVTQAERRRGRNKAGARYFEDRKPDSAVDTKKDAKKVVKRGSADDSEATKQQEPIKKQVKKNAEPLKKQPKKTAEAKTARTKKAAGKKAATNESDEIKIYN